MYIMPTSTASDATRESALSDFSHSLLDLWRALYTHTPPFFIMADLAGEPPPWDIPRARTALDGSTGFERAREQLAKRSLPNALPQATRPKSRDERLLTG
jgi:hypothetical protein